MIPRLLADENFPMPAIRALRGRGVDVLAIQETCPSARDIEVLAMACDQKRWLATYDRDYGELVFRRDLRPPPAILYFRQEPFPATRAADLIVPLLERAGELEGYLVVVGEHSLRLHKLPA